VLYARILCPCLGGGTTGCDFGAPVTLHDHTEPQGAFFGLHFAAQRLETLGNVPDRTMSHSRSALCTETPTWFNTRLPMRWEDPNPIFTAPAIGGLYQVALRLHQTVNDARYQHDFGLVLMNPAQRWVRINSLQLALLSHLVLLHLSMTN